MPTAVEKLAMVEETYAPDVTVSLVARRNGVQPNQLFHWRKLAAQGALTATSAEGEVVAASEYRALQNQVREFHHATLAIAAYGFLVSERSLIPPSAPRSRPFLKAPALSEDYRPRGAAAPSRTPPQQFHHHHPD